MAINAHEITNQNDNTPEVFFLNFWSASADNEFALVFNSCCFTSVKLHYFKINFSPIERVV
jgi:hypothetical protein